MSTVHFLSQLDQHTLIEQIVVALIAYLRAGMFAMVPQFLSLKVFWHSYSDCVLEKWQEMKLEIFIKKKKKGFSNTDWFPRDVSFLLFYYWCQFENES